MSIPLEVEPLTKEAFAPFGEVIETEGAEQMSINNGLITRFHGLASVDVTDTAPLISIFRGNGQTLPVEVDLLEKHPLGSQAFFPLSPVSWLVVVAPTLPDGNPGALRAFRPQPGQGFNLARATWHAPLLPLEPGDFLTVDRGGADNMVLLDLPEEKAGMIESL